jgi:serine/threonine-protein phosphatase PP1 catalytic subunit
MSVSGELLCSFELLKPLDSSALKSHIKKSRNMRQSMLNSPVCTAHDGVLNASPLRAIYSISCTRTDCLSARPLRSSKLLTVSSPRVLT